MNKQQLAAKIWESANKMRSKIEANEYKDYILGFIFYKFLSEKEVKYLKANDWTDEYLPELTEEDTETVESIQKNLGYFISYDNLFSTWLAKGSDFSVQDVRDALSAFSRLINPTHKKVLRAFLIHFKQACQNWEIVHLHSLNLSATLFSLSKIFLWTVSKAMTFLALFMNT